MYVLTAEQDYIPVSATDRTFTPTTSNLAHCVPLTILMDTIIENDEFLVMRLTPNGDAVNILEPTATVFIRDDDGKTSIATCPSDTKELIIYMKAAFKG